MICLSLGDEISPLSSVKIKLRPFSLAQLTWPNEQHRRKPKRTQHRKCTGETIERTEHLAHLRGFGNRCEVGSLGWWNCAKQVSGSAVLTQPFLDAVAKYPTRLFTQAMSRIACAPPIHSLEHLQHLRGVNLRYGPAAEPREGIILEAGQRLFILCRLDIREALCHPGQCDHFECIDSCTTGRAFVRLLGCPRIDACGKLFPSFITLLACCRQRHIGVNAQCQRLILAVEPIVHPPILCPRLNDLEVHAAAI